MSAAQPIQIKTTPISPFNNRAPSVKRAVPRITYAPSSRKKSGKGAPSEKCDHAFTRSPTKREKWKRKRMPPSGVKQKPRTLFIVDTYVDVN